MKKWCDRGFWSKNAIANTSGPRDAFENGSAASLIWNIYTLGASVQTIMDESNITTEIAALSNLFTKYIYLMDLGAVEDVEATLEEFNQQAEAVGLDKVLEELDSQVKAYYNSLGK